MNTKIADTVCIVINLSSIFLILQFYHVLPMFIMYSFSIKIYNKSFHQLDMLPKLFCMNLKKNWPYFLFVAVVPFLYNKISLSGRFLNTPVDAYFLMLYTLTGLFMLLTARFISYLVHRYQEDLKWRSRSLLFLYYGIGILIIFSVLFLFTAVWYYPEDRFWEIMWAHAKYRFSIYLLSTVALTVWLVHFPEYVWFKRSAPVLKDTKPVPSIFEDQEAPKFMLFTFYDHLYSRGLGVVFNELGEVQFPGIVYIEKFSKRAVVYLIDGSSFECPDILDKLKYLGLDQWMVKVSQRYHFNMMHVYYPEVRKGNHLLLQHKTVEYMLSNGVRQQDLVAACLLGPRIGKYNVDEFMKNRADLNYEVWDDFVLIKKRDNPVL